MLQLHTLPEHMHLPLVGGGVRSCMIFLYSILYIIARPFSFAHCFCLSYDLRLLITPLVSSNFS
jgi:hypothetical protein